jgi:hypothetical protein
MTKYIMTSLLILVSWRIHVSIFAAVPIFTSRLSMTFLLKAAQQPSGEITLIYSCILTTLTNFSKLLKIKVDNTFVLFPLSRWRGLSSLPACRHRQAWFNKTKALHLSGALMNLQDNIYVCMYVCMYKGGPKTGPRTATFNDLLCFPFRLALD